MISLPTPQQAPSTEWIPSPSKLAPPSGGQSEDPQGSNNQDPQSLHKYTYCHNNPVNALDPSGRFVGSIGLAGGLSIGATVQSAISVVALTVGYIIVDTLLDKLRKKGSLWHVRDKTLIRLAKRFNKGALIAGNMSRMYFTPINFVPPIIDIVGLLNNAFFQGGISAAIKIGAWDLRTKAGIAAFVAARPQAADGIAADPSLGEPSREPVLVISASKDSWYAPMYGGGIAVKNELSRWHPVSLIFKSVVTLPGEHVEFGKYKTIPEVVE